MKIGVHLPQWGAGADRSGVLRVARAAEASGLDSVWAADHIVHPAHTSRQYPYRSGGVPFSSEEGFLEALTMLSVVAGATERVGLGTSVLVLPMREPLTAAKTIATLDVLSDGRTIFALGAGWWLEEFEAVGAPFASRGARLDEQVEIMRRAWTAGTFSFTGDHYRFAEITCRPLPRQPGGPPLLLGGTAPSACQRAGRIGDGWHAVGADLDRLRDGVKIVTESAREAGRDPSSLVLSTTCSLALGEAAGLDRLAALHGLGFTNVVVNFRGASTPAQISDAIERFGDELLPEVRRLA